jgi:hypothetical protein
LLSLEVPEPLLLLALPLLPLRHVLASEVGRAADHGGAEKRASSSTSHRASSLDFPVSQCDTAWRVGQDATVAQHPWYGVLRMG